MFDRGVEIRDRVCGGDQVDERDVLESVGFDVSLRHLSVPSRAHTILSRPSTPLPRKKSFCCAQSQLLNWRQIFTADFDGSNAKGAGHFMRVVH
jgi:hypothetical protein